ncbi:MAG TPA: APC family permease [Pseudonocardiaceae bacterium]|jgi:amino acid transporter
MSTPAPRLTRTLTLGPVVLFGLAYMAPMIVLGTFGSIDDSSGRAAPTAYALALVAMLFTAVSYGRMSRAFPVAGSAYTYTRKTIDGRIGFLVGWAVLLDYFFLPMVIWLIGATFLNQQFPEVPNWAWIVAFIVVTTVVNVIGIKLAANANLLLTGLQILVLIFFVILSLRHVGQSHPIFSGAPFGNSATTIGTIAAGAGIAGYSFLGFDAITTLTEETKEPKRNIPRAIVLVTVIGGVIFLVTSYAAQYVGLGLQHVDPNSEAFDIAKVIGGNLFSAFFLAGLVITQLASGIAAQASAARLLFAMGRDSVLPKKIFGYLHPKFHTPVLNILAIGVVGLVGIANSVSNAVSFINFGAFTAFTFVNFCVIAFAIRNRRFRTPVQILGNAVAPIIGAGFDIWLLTQLDGAAHLLGLIWLGLGIIYLIFLTKGFRRPPPEVDFSEDTELAPTA